MVQRVSSLVVLGVLVMAPSMAFADGLPKRVGQCVETRIKELGPRLEGAPDSGSTVIYENGVFGVSYEVEAVLKSARVGDPVKLCLVSVPKKCPPGDDEGNRI